MANEGIANPHDVDHDHDCNEENRSSTKSQVSVGTKGAINKFFAPRTTPRAQPSIKSAMVEKAKMVVARWGYDANITIQCSSI